MKIDQRFFENCRAAGMNSISRHLYEKTRQRFDHASSKDSKIYKEVVERLPELSPSSLDLNSDTIQIGKAEDCSPGQRMALKNQFMQLHPWRKGPYNVFDIFIDTEWRSDWKWQRLKDHITPLEDRLVLDVGCGNGYHLWRMAGAGAKIALGVDPFLLSVFQFLALQKYIGKENTAVLPLGIEDLPQKMSLFDTVFSMGVLYHRRSPIDHLFTLRGLLRSGGELVLETLVIEGKAGETLVPEGRYAKMRNVWFIPSALTLESWLRRCGYKNIRLIDITKTTTSEQRSTEWMRFESLADFLDPHDDRLTMEGLPAPKRAVFLAETP